MGLSFEAVLIGAEQLDIDLQEIPANVSRFAAEEFEEAGQDIVELMQQYPPESEANQPPPPYYIRGTGYIGRGGNVEKPSQQLGQQWSVTVGGKDDLVDVSVLNTATYSAWVHGAQLQTAFHAQRGWRKLSDVARESLEGRGSTGMSLRDRAINVLNKVKGLFGR